jgi:hypothetical protein
MLTHDDASAIAALDLDPIKVKLMHEASGEGWSPERANSVEFEYRRFLYLMKKYPHEQTAPLFDVDIFWHYHILDTVKYAQDCENVFGYFLHHFPYIGLRGKDDEEAHHRVGERMRVLYEENFAEPYGSYSSVGASGQVTGTAFSGAAVAAQSARASKVAFSGATAAVAFSGAATQSAPVAFSGAQARTAFSGAQAQVAFSGAQARTAFSGAQARTALSGAQAQTAFSGAQAHAAFSGAQVQVAFSGASAKQAGQDFYASRPTLTPAA